jgi:hypothetical protein
VKKPLATLLLVLVTACAGPAPSSAPPHLSPPPRSAVESSDPAILRLRAQAKDLEPLCESALGRAFLAATPLLPPVSERSIHHDRERTRYLSGPTFAALPEKERSQMVEERGGSELYYETHYGTPLAYARAIDLAGAAGVSSLSGKRVLDFGYGTIGHLRLLAANGADAVGVDVDPFLAALYSESSDQGPFPPGEGATGRVTLVNGRFPADEPARTRVGGGFSLVISKNTLKNGYLHPEGPVSPRAAFSLGVSDDAFVATLRDVLVPDGLVLLYNAGPPPAKAGEPYRPHADGRSPFSRSQWEKGGFQVLAFDQEDSPSFRAMARVFRWDREMEIDIETGIFAMYTLVRRLR